MKRLVRRAAIGTIAGLVASLPLIAALGRTPIVLVLGAVLGASYAVLTGSTPGDYLDNVFTAGGYGVPLWALISVTALPPRVAQLILMLFSP